MKIATGIIAVMLGLLVLLQSCTIGAGSSLLGDQATADAGAVGIIAGFFLFVGGAFSFGLPMIGGIVFLAAALVAFTGVEQFPDLQVWAVLALVLAAMALFAWWSDRKKRQASSAKRIEAGQQEAGQ
ncbi:hypothetical protein N7E02_18335 [Aliirhizobium terrae]|uniref:hypothetical protein n=1 Tax=Terrirhizobium terrae TaxID=2926709 RepID=UPI002576EE70|nr:hypothetical protein [Rhizobium sp. CC-CFT758]WJH38895.1 hypothetical protein N7E02_18335 [Rhizobium sp. CC-CFT758]